MQIWHPTELDALEAAWVHLVLVDQGKSGAIAALVALDFRLDSTLQRLQSDLNFVPWLSGKNRRVENSLPSLGI